jgi:hypothetical protein
MYYERQILYISLVRSRTTEQILMGSSISVKSVKTLVLIGTLTIHRFVSELIENKVIVHFNYFWNFRVFSG